MNLFVVFCIILVSLLSVVSFVRTVRTEKRIQKNILKQPIVVELKTDLKDAVKNMNFFKEQAIEWNKRYIEERKEHQHTFNTLTAEIKEMKTEMNNMKFIIGRMDGKRLVRDSSGNITEMKIVK